MQVDNVDDTYPEANRVNEARRLIFVTNRGPVEHSFADDGSMESQRGAGGVVSGLLSAIGDRPVSWISLAMTDADRVVAEETEPETLAAPAGLEQLSTRLVSVPAEMYQHYYEGFSNHILWFAQHDMLAAGHFTQEAHEDWDGGYRPVNKAVAQAVIEELKVTGDTTPVMFHDYHLYLAPEMVRAQKPNARLLHFIHTPWPTCEQWQRAVPSDYVHAIFRGLVANDVIGFQTQHDVDNFLHCAGRFFPEAEILHGPDRIYWRGRFTQVRAYPIAVTPSVVYESAQASAAQQAAHELLREAGSNRQRKLILRVDRLEPTKNIVKGFEAYEQLLEANPTLRERVVFLALLVPTREGLEEYQDYAEQVRTTIERINQRFGVAGWQPITAIYGNDHARALACMQHYDVLLVNPLVDGMNLVVKEGGLLNQRKRNGVIILSKTAGAYEQLHNGVLGINPQDVSATAAALHQALTMPMSPRAELASGVRGTLLAEDAEKWLNQQYQDLIYYTKVQPEEQVSTPPSLVNPHTQQWLNQDKVQYYSSAKTQPLGQHPYGRAALHSDFTDMPSPMIPLLPSAQEADDQQEQMEQR